MRRQADLPSAFLISSMFPGTEPSPSKVAEHRELAEQLETVLIGLSEHERRMFVMRRLCAIPFREIAAELGVANAATARSLYSRLMTRVLAQLPDLPEA